MLFGALASRLRCLFKGHTLRFVRLATTNERRLYKAEVFYRCATCPALIFNNTLPPHLQKRRPSVPLSPVGDMHVPPGTPELPEEGAHDVTVG